MIPLERLAVIPVLSGVAPELRERLAERLREEPIPAGRLIFNEGGPGDAVYFIAEGKVSIQKDLDKARGLSKTLAVMQTGDFFGEMALLEREPRSASAIAVEATTLLVLPVEDVRAWLSADARVPLRLLLPFVEALSARLRETTREMTLFFNVGRVLVQDPDSHRLGAELLETVILAFDDPVTAGFWLWNDFSGEYEMIAGKGLWTEAHRGARSEKDPLFAWLMEKKECALAGDWSTDERFAAAQTAWPSLRSLVGRAGARRASPHRIFCPLPRGHAPLFHPRAPTHVGGVGQSGRAVFRQRLPALGKTRPGKTQPCSTGLPMTPSPFRDVAKTASAAADDKKARNIRIYDTAGSSGVADYFLLATVDSAPQMNAVQEEIDRCVKTAHGLDPLRRDGRGSAQWQVLDYGGLVVHLMTENARVFYGLERLWEHARALDAAPAKAPRAARRTAKPAARRRRRST
jgi:ribosome-associated protein